MSILKTSQDLLTHTIFRVGPFMWPQPSFSSVWVNVSQTTMKDIKLMTYISLNETHCTVFLCQRESVYYLETRRKEMERIKKQKHKKGQKRCSSKSSLISWL